MVYYLGGYSSNSHFIQDFLWYPPQLTSRLVFINPGLTLWGKFPFFIFSLLFTPPSQLAPSPPNAMCHSAAPSTPALWDAARPNADACCRRRPIDQPWWSVSLCHPRPRFFCHSKRKLFWSPKWILSWSPPASVSPPHSKVSKSPLPSGCCWAASDESPPRRGFRCGRCFPRLPSRTDPPGRCRWVWNCYRPWSRHRALRLHGEDLLPTWRWGCRTNCWDLEWERHNLGHSNIKCIKD